MEKIIYSKTINVGKFPIRGRKIATAEVNVELRQEDDGFIVLSICACVYNTAYPSNWYMSGQCIDEIAKYIRHCKMRQINEIWKRWHLNDLHAGCEHQREFEKEPYENHALEVCPICGHKYGADWQREKLPQNVIETVKSW